MQHRFLAIALLPLLCSCASSPVSSSEPTPTKRDIIVAEMTAMATVRWTPKRDIAYYDEELGKAFRAGETYIGLPYTMGKGRTDSYGDPLGTFLNSLEDDGFTYDGPSVDYLGSDCSSSVEGAWRKAGLQTGANYTGAMIPGINPNILAVGDYVVTSSSTASIIEENGKDAMFAAYDSLQPGDALVKRSVNGGHVRLVESVDPDVLLVTVIEQCGYGIDSQTVTTWRLRRTYTYESLLSYSYIPITPKGL